MIVVRIISLLLVLLGVILIFDARPITIEWFSFGDQNEGVSALKILGFIIAIIGGIIFYIVK